MKIRIKALYTLLGVCLLSPLTVPAAATQAAKPGAFSRPAVGARCLMGVLERRAGVRAVSSAPESGGRTLTGPRRRPDADDLREGTRPVRVRAVRDNGAKAG